MSDSQLESWSDNPNAPETSYRLYFLEKTWFAGHLIDSILYGRRKRSPPTHPPSVLTAFFGWFTLGMLVVLFFKCMTTLFNPVHRRGEGIKWGLVSYTVAMFSLATIYTATRLHILSICYIDDRAFPGGPYIYGYAIRYKTITIISSAAFYLGGLLADGLLVSS